MMEELEKEAIMRELIEKPCLLEFMKHAVKWNHKEIQTA